MGFSKINKVDFGLSKVKIDHEFIIQIIDPEIDRENITI
jgi:hypothetical protein